MSFMTPAPPGGKEEAHASAAGNEKAQPDIAHGLHPAGFQPRFVVLLRMGGRVVDRARLESVFTFIGNEGSNPSPSGSLLEEQHITF